MSGSQGVCELLGYPPDARLLIVNADDFGMCHAQNEGGIRAITGGLASSCSLMVPPPWSQHASHLLRENPEIPFGVHLTAVSEYAYYRWGPVSTRDRVPSLLDESGYFPLDSRFKEVVGRSDSAELELEFRAQIEAVLAAGLRPTHLDSHYHTHELRPDIRRMTVGLALEYGMALRLGYWVEAGATSVEGYPTVDHPILDSGRIRPEEKAAVLSRRLRELPAGLTEWALHPGVATEELRAIMSGPGVQGATGTPEGRQSDLDFITSAEAAAIVKGEGIEIISYQPLQRAWQQMKG